MTKSQIAQLIKYVQKGDAEAFAQIYNLYFNSVYYLALKLTKNEHDARDAAQDTMLNLYRNIHNVSTQKSLSAYINKIAYNSSIDVLRKRKGSLRQDDDAIDALEQIAEDNADFIPHRFVENMETRNLLLELIDELNDTLKSVIILFYYNELSIKQIARILNIQESAVKKRLVRGREVLKKQIEKHDHRKGVFRALAVPILTQIMREEAKAVCLDSVKCEIWGNVCRSAQLADAVVSATMPIVLGKASIAPRENPRYIKSFVSIGAAAAVIMVLFNNSEVIKKPSLSYANSNISVEDSLASENSADASDGSKRASLVFAPFGQLSDGYIAPSSEAASSGVAQQHFENIPHPDELSDDWEYVPEQPPTMSEHSGGYGEVGKQEKTVPYSPGSGGQTNSPAASVVQVFSQMRLNKNILFYPAGTELTIEKILEEAGGHAFDKYGNEIELTVSRLDSVNTDYPGRYSVYIHTISRAPFLSMEVVIIIEA